MTRINTNVAALISSRILGQNTSNLQKSLQRLSTGYRINSGADDPAGLIASENLRGQMAATQSAISNSQRAESVVSTADGALNEISNMLVQLQGLTNQAASTGGMTKDEIQANQTQVDSIVNSVDRISSQTSFEGMKLLDGSMDFDVSATGGTTNLTDIRVLASKQGGAAKTVTVSTTTAATVASGFAMSAAVGGAGSITFEVRGNKGATVLTFAASTTQAQMASAINAASGLTGVRASGGQLLSSDYGANAFVSVRKLTGTATGGLATGSAKYGTNAVVAIDGSNASVSGNQASLRTSMLDIEFTMQNAFMAAPGSENVTIAGGGGATFQLSPDVSLNGQETLGIQSVAAHNLGSQATGYLSDLITGMANDLSTNPSGAQQIVQSAIQQVSTLRGRLGSFVADTVEPNINSLQVAYENTSSSESQIRDVDFATETANMSRNQVLVSAATSVLATANSTPQSVLRLLQ